MKLSHVVVLFVALLAGLIIGAKAPGITQTVTLGLVKTG